MTCKITNIQSLPYLMTIKDLQSSLGVGRETAYGLCNDILAPATLNIAGKYRIKRDEIFKLLETRTVANTI